VPWIVLTDEPDDFADLPVRAIRHTPTGPMAVDYLTRLPPTGGERGSAAYHDKRFALIAALEDFETAIYLDADSRISGRLSFGGFPSGIAVPSDITNSISGHLNLWGSWRIPVFVDLARYLTGNDDVLHTARWCQENVFALTRDGRESRFFDAWGRAADFLQERGVFSGEGGVIGLAAACAGWDVDYKVLSGIGSSIRHEGGGPKEA
jgi:hypothetical protein